MPINRHDQALPQLLELRLDVVARGDARQRRQPAKTENVEIDLGRVDAREDAFLARASARVGLHIDVIADQCHEPCSLGLNHLC